MKKTAFWITLITIVSQVTGFLRDTTLSQIYGASDISDAYLIAIGIPMTLFNSLGQGLSSSFLPVYSKILKEEGKKEGDLYTNRAISVMLVVCTGMILVVWVFAPQLIFIFASGFSEKTSTLAIGFLRVAIITVYVMSVTYIWRSYLQVRNRFIKSAFMGIPMNIVIILSIIISGRLGLWALIIGYVLAYATQAMSLLPDMRQENWRFQFDLKWKDPALISMIMMMIPMAFGASVGQLNVVVDRTIASWVMTGGISLLTYVSRLTGMVQVAFGATIISILFPSFAKYAAESQETELKIALRNGLNSTSLLTVPAMIGLMTLSKPIIKLVFERGAFTSESTVAAGGVLFMYSMGVWGIGIRELIVRVFYAYHDTKIPVINTTVSLGLNIVLNILLSKTMGLEGVALATSMSAVFSTVWLGYSLRKKIGPYLTGKLFWASNIKILLSSGAMAVTIHFTYTRLCLTLPSNWATVVSILIGILTYGALVLLMRVEEVNFVWERIHRKR